MTSTTRLVITVMTMGFIAILVFSCAAGMSVAGGDINRSININSHNTTITSTTLPPSDELSLLEWMGNISSIMVGLFVGTVIYLWGLRSNG